MNGGYPMSPNSTQTNNQNKKRVWSYISAFFSRWSGYQYKQLGFILLLLLSVGNILFMTFHFIDDTYNYPILQHSYISAVGPNQDVNDTLSTSIVKITAFDEQQVQVGDQVVIYGDFGTTEYWVEEVVDVLPETRQVELRYVNNITITTRFDNILGVYQNDANIIGQIYYSAKFVYGYVLWIIVHLFLLGGYYYILLIKKEKVNE
jgi:hypothetical protein